MFDTVSVFDAMELDNSQQRVASRRALALAHNRVENNLGRFLRAATSEEEFEERLALVLDDFDGYVTTASNEAGHDKPEHIAAALKDHYRLAAQPVEFVKTPEEEEKEEEEEGKVSRWKITSIEGKQSAPLAGPYPNGQDPLDEWDLEAPHGGPHAFFDQQGINAPTAQDPIRNYEGYIGPNAPKDIAHDEGYENIPYVVDPNAPAPQTQRDYGNDQGLQIQPNLPGVEVPPKYPNRYQGSNEHQNVTCPECGGDGKQAGVNTCGKCKGAGKVPNFGDSMVDNVGADIKTAENHNNTDLDGPEPKMDKRLWTPQSVKPLPDAHEDSGRWPTKQKDIVEPIKATNDSELKEIGEKSTEHQSLPSNSGDAGYDAGGPGPAPHTDTFGNDGQTDPVSREALSSVDEGSQNPLSKLLLEQSVPSEQVVQAAFERHFG